MFYVSRKRDQEFGEGELNEVNEVYFPFVRILVGIQILMFYCYVMVAVKNSEVLIFTL